jgi:SPP1 family predicted phage head-tail adaptor
MTNPGLFKHRISFQSRDNDAKNENGFPLSEQENPYVNIVTVWAQNKTISGREYTQAATTQNERTVRWIIRYRKGLTEDMRVIYDGRTFEIDTILPDDEQKKTLTVVCKELL